VLASRHAPPLPMELVGCSNSDGTVELPFYGTCARYGCASAAATWRPSECSQGSPGPRRVPGLAADRRTKLLGGGPAGLCRALQPASSASGARACGTGPTCWAGGCRRGSAGRGSSTRSARRSAPRIPASCMNAFAHPTGQRRSAATPSGSSVRQGRWPPPRRRPGRLRPAIARPLLKLACLAETAPHLALCHPDRVIADDTASGIVPAHGRWVSRP
jgi:hypothetical protein